ncbi:MAG: IclR family transcriptional regulator [Sphingomonadales bacterium]|nr:IclR family transcriptional regulator [Sphingomonadales bacterium]MDE2567350.1 IclR family transcriptional regulator [Sphingomonadales bacterium]
MVASAPPAPVKSAMRTLDVIEFVVAHPRGVIAQEISAALQIPVSSLSYLLATLAERGYLVRDGRNYVPGPGLERLRAAKEDLPLADRVAPLVRALRSELNETASFFVRIDDDAEAIVTEASAQALRYAIDPGARRPLHALAAGKAMLSRLCEAELAEYLSHGARARMTAHTRTGEEDLREDLAKVRAEGFCTVCEEATAGICGVAVPAQIGGEMVGAFSVAVPAVRFDAVLEARIKALLLRAAAALAEG